MTTRKTIVETLDPDHLAIAIRRAGGAAHVERLDGRDVVITDRSAAFVRKLCRELKWITPNCRAE